MNGAHARHIPVRTWWTRVILALLPATCALAMRGQSPALALNPAPAQICYVSLPENDAYTALYAIGTVSTSPLNTYISIPVSSNGTLIDYDQRSSSCLAPVV